MKNQTVKNYQTERREQLIEAGYTSEEARKIAFQETQKDLLAKIHDSMLNEVIQYAFISGFQYARHFEKKEATHTQRKAMNNTKKIIRQMLHN